MKNNQDAKLFIFNPHADEIISNLKDKIDENRMKKMPFYFGTETGKKAIIDMAHYGLQ